MHGGLSDANPLFPPKRGTCGRLWKLRPHTTRSCLANDVSADAARCLHGRLGRNVSVSGGSAASTGGAMLHRNDGSWHGKAPSPDESGRFGGEEGCSGVALSEERSLWCTGERCDEDGDDAHAFVGVPAVLLPAALLPVGLLSLSNTRSGTRCSFDVRHTEDRGVAWFWSTLASSTGIKRQSPTGKVRHTLETRATTPVSVTSTRSPLLMAVAFLSVFGVAAAAVAAAADERLNRLAVPLRGVGQTVNRVAGGGVVAVAAGAGVGAAADDAAFVSAGGKPQLLREAETPQPMYRGGVGGEKGEGWGGGGGGKERKEKGGGEWGSFARRGTRLPT
eukprot:Rhum_TRINITY_DN15440_c6_g2::Rhum_TRINITY_DN15440_c6_g2_i1::g.157150::m.157150